MSITLAYSATTIDLPEDLYWVDENSWHPVEQNSKRTLTGALIVQVATRQAGRPITLQPEDDRSAAMSRATLDVLRTWAAVAGREMTLTLRGVSRTVIFRHEDTAIEATPFIHYSDVQSEDFYLATLRFLEI
jgi:hypothetical protein